MSRILSSRLVRTAVATAAATSALFAASAAQAAVAPAIDRTFGAPTPNAEPDSFYTPPSPLPAGNPGDVLRARPAKAGPPTARSLANAWQVMYLSTDALGRPDAVTGTILVPKAATDPSKLNIVGLAPGTTGPAFRCTVSRFINSGSFYEQAIVNGLLKAGYAVAVTDYEGYKENPTTSYIVGKSMGPALLDVLRAAQRLPESGLSATAKVATQGFSQGGGASMWAGQLQPTYAPELNLVGVSAGGVPADLVQVSLGLNGKPAFGFLLDALIGLNNAYPELLLDSYLNDNGRATVAEMAADDCTLELLVDYQNKTTNEYLSTVPFLKPAWLARLNENKLGATKIDVPVYQYHADNDPIVRYDQAVVLRDKYCALGVTLSFKTFDTGHVTTVARGNADALAFLADRFAGKPAASTCAPQAQ
jgi:hypothetical protein